MITSKAVAGGLCAGLLLFAASPARAAPPTKDECVDAFSKGQDAREAGQFVLAGKLFLTCAQPACPDLVQRDCARFADETERQKPSVTFAARDGAQADLPDTSVFVDGALFADRLGDGRAHDIDPGHHEVRFVHAGKEVTLTVVVAQGEKGRALVGMFPAPAATAPSLGALPGGTTPAAAAPATVPDAPAATRPAGPFAGVGLGAAAMIAGGVTLGVGLAGVPARCSLSTHLCAAPPGDPVFVQASNATRLVNVGAVLGGAGAATLVASLIGYFAQAPRVARAAEGLVPWVGTRGGGVAFRGAM